MLRRSISPKSAKCKHCKKAMPDGDRRAIHELCVIPWLVIHQSKQDAKRAKAERARKKAERASDKVRKQALKTIAQLIAEAQTAFNSFIRERDKDKGCFVCGRPFLAGVPGRALHAGHVRSRGAAGHLRFKEDNCLGECEGCNGPHGAKPHQIEAGAIARIGQEKYDALKSDNEPHKWQRDELINIRAHFKALKAAA